MTRTMLPYTAVLALGLAGCAPRLHLSPDQGKATEAALRRQAPAAKYSMKGPVSGLDSQEAAIVAQGYRRSLAPKSVQPKEQPILILGAPPESGGYVLPPPSVPKE